MADSSKEAEPEPAQVGTEGEGEDRRSDDWLKPEKCFSARNCVLSTVCFPLASGMWFQRGVCGSQDEPSKAGFCVGLLCGLTFSPAAMIIRKSRSLFLSLGARCPAWLACVLRPSCTTLGVAADSAPLRAGHTQRPKLIKKETTTGRAIFGCCFSGICPCLSMYQMNGHVGVLTKRAAAQAEGEKEPIVQAAQEMER